MFIGYLYFIIAVPPPTPPVKVTLPFTFHTEREAEHILAVHRQAAWVCGHLLRYSSCSWRLALSLSNIPEITEVNKNYLGEPMLGLTVIVL